MLLLHQPNIDHPHCCEPLVEDPDPVPLVGVGGPHAGGGDLVDLEHVGLLVPGAQVAAAVKILHS